MKLEILTFPNKKLQLVSKPVTKFDEELAQFAYNLLETMADSGGIGLAAPQVDRPIRVIAVDLTPESKDYQGLVMVNPEIIEEKGTFTFREGCLSVPGYYDEITRAKEIKVAFKTPDGRDMILEFSDLVAVCIQHEVGHLNGELFIDKLPETKQMIVKNKLLVGK